MPSKLEQLQLQFRQRLLQEKESKMVKIQSNGQQKPESKVSENSGMYQQKNSQSLVPPYTPSPKANPPPAVSVTSGVYQEKNLLSHHPPYISSPKVTATTSVSENSGGYQQKNSLSHNPPFTPSPKSNSTSAVRLPQSTKKGTSGVDRSRPLPPIQKNPKPGSSALNNSVNSPGNLSYVKSVAAENGGISTRSPLSEYKSSVSKPVSNGKAKLSGETFKVVHTESKLKQVDPEKTKFVKKAPSDRETKTKVNSPSLSCYTSVQRDTANGKPHNSSKTRIRQEAKCTPTKKESVPSKKPINNAISRVSKLQSDPNLEECSICGRRFAKDRIEKHTSICKKSSQKTRKIFDATKMRVKGTEAESFLRKKNPKIEVKPKKSNWRKQHENFLASIREAKAVQRHLASGGKISDLPPPTPSDTSDYVQCPYCKRKFSEAAAERHIPKCKNIVSNKKAKK